MDTWVWAGFLAFFVVSAVVGTRLVLLWRRTRQLPELLIGVGVLGIGPIGFGAMILGSALMASGLPADSPVVRSVFALGTATVACGVLAKCVFNWRVYRPDSAAARAATAAIGAGLAGLYVHAGVARGFLPAVPVDAWTVLQSALQVGALLWGSAEALRYWRLMRRRTALGLADAVVTNRFLLWACGAAAAGIGTAIGTGASWWTGEASIRIPWVIASSSAHGLVAAIAMWLAFVPPRAYTAWIRGSATAPARA
jgi:hypothetical protein